MSFMLNEMMNYFPCFWNYLWFYLFVWSLVFNMLLIFLFSLFRFQFNSTILDELIRESNSIQRFNTKVLNWFVPWTFWIRLRIGTGVKWNSNSNSNISLEFNLFFRFMNYFAEYQKLIDFKDSEPIQRIWLKLRWNSESFWIESNSTIWTLQILYETLEGFLMC